MGLLCVEALLNLSTLQLGSLQDVLDAQARLGEQLPEKEVVNHMTQLCSALAFMHGALPCIAHRDVKPGNCLRRADGQLLLTDFGSAVMVPVRVDTPQESRRLKDEAAELCTMPYRAPELFSCDVGLCYDAAVDVWVSAGTQADEQHALEKECKLDDSIKFSL